MASSRAKVKHYAWTMTLSVQKHVVGANELKLTGRDTNKSAKCGRLHADTAVTQNECVATPERTPTTNSTMQTCAVRLNLDGTVKPVSATLVPLTRGVAGRDWMANEVCSVAIIKEFGVEDNARASTVINHALEFKML